MDKRQQAKAAKLAGDLRALIEKAAELAADLERGLAGDGVTGSEIRLVLDVFAQAWARRYGQRYVFAGAKDAAATKRLLRTLAPEELARRAERYLSSDEAFYVRARHGFNVFVASVNSLVGAEEVTRPVGCEHEAPCASEAACTSRRMRELRQ